MFRVLYAGSTRLCCFLETLARFRKPPLDFLDDLSEIQHAEDDHIPLGKVPGSWLTRRLMGAATLRPGLQYADAYSHGWLGELRPILEPEARRLGFLTPGEIFDLSTLLEAKHRSLTQRAATFIYDENFDGIYYRSRHGTDLENWALFEKPNGDFGILHQEKSADIFQGDADFADALKVFDLEIDFSQ